MDRRLQSLIDQSIEAQHFVKRVLTVELGIELPQHPLAGHHCSRPENHQKSVAANLSIFPHGIGLRFYGKGLWIDFDFGINGELGAFDAYRLHEFNLKNHLGITFYSSDEIKSAIQDAVELEEITFSKEPIQYFLVPTTH